MRNIRNNIVYLWWQLSPAMRWLVLLAHGIGYVVVAVAFDPFTALFGVVVGTVGISGIVVAALFPWYVLDWLIISAFSLPRSSRWWLGPFALAAAYGCTKLSYFTDTSNDWSLYGVVAIGWCVILSILCFHTPPKYGE